MKEIKLTRNSVSLVDDADYEKFKVFSWHCTEHGYAGRRDKKNKFRYLHRDIMKPKKGFVVDHIDGNKLNNQRQNLRVVTQQQNCFNSHKSYGEVPYRGVYNSNKWHEKQGWSLKKPYAAKIEVNGKVYWLGRYASAEEAYLVYLKAKKKLHKI